MNDLKTDRFDEGGLIRRATAAWLRWCRRKGRIEEQPSAARSEYRGGIVTLRNVNGNLAAYKVVSGRRLRSVRRLEVQGVPDRATP